MKSLLMLPMMLVAIFANTALSETTVEVEKTSETKPFWLRIDAGRLNIRTMPTTSCMIVARLERDSVLRAVGEVNGWYKILPPEGTFSLVHSDYIDQRSETRGIVSLHSGTLRVRAGSLVYKVNPMQSEVQTRLEFGAEVTLMGKQDDWYKIVPPKNVFFYVSSDHVEKITDAQAQKLIAAQKKAAERAEKQQNLKEGEVDTTGVWGEKLESVEAKIHVESKKPTLDQQWGPLIVELSPIAKQTDEKKVAQLANKWIESLKDRQVKQEALRKAKALLEKTTPKKDADSGNPTPRKVIFDAKGQLLESVATKNDERRLYVLQNPISNKVVAYVVFPKAAKINEKQFLECYVGVRGEKTYDEKLKCDLIRVRAIGKIKTAKPTTQPTRKDP